ncbi:hypothetical protein GCM10010349_16320 [Streptomyces flavofungini]|nr:hypothetical protein GCM10010349_16320 [Streptomyces flavofungini]
MPRPPYRPREDGIEFVGRDSPRLFPASRREASAAPAWVVGHRLAGFGPHEDAMLAAEPVMRHSPLSSSLNLGPLDLAEYVERAEDAWHAGRAPLSSVEGFIRSDRGLARVRVAPVPVPAPHERPVRRLRLLAHPAHR